MADSTIAVSESSSFAQSDCDGESAQGSVGPGYAEIVVVRHGETEWNADGRIQGHLDVELNEVGREQAAAVANRLSNEPKISAVYTSDLKRALETAQVISSSCGSLQVIQDPDLRERHLGDMQGLVYREAAKLKPKAYRAFSSPRTDQEIPALMDGSIRLMSISIFEKGGGESLDQLYHRCTSALERIGMKHQGQRVVVVTHGGVIRSLYERAAPMDRSPGKIGNTSVNVFYLSDGGEVWSIKTRNDISHLSKTGFLKNAFGGDKNSGLLSSKDNRTIT